MMSPHIEFDFLAQRELDRLSKKWLHISVELLKFYIDIQKKFQATLTSDQGDSLQINQSIRQQLAPAFFDPQFIARISERLDAMLELKFEIKNAISQKTVLQPLGAELLDVSNRLIKLCDLHIEFSKYQKNSLNLAKTASIVDSINDLNIRWQLFYSKLNTLKQYNVDVQFNTTLEYLETAGLIIDITWPQNIPSDQPLDGGANINQTEIPPPKVDQDSTMLLTTICQILTALRSLFKSIYGDKNAYFEIVFLQILPQAQAQSLLRCQIITSKSWQLSLGTFLNSLLGEDYSENKVLQLAGDAIFLHQQTLKSPKRKLMAHQKEIEKALKNFPAGCKVNVLNFDITDENSLKNTTGHQNIKYNADNPALKDGSYAPDAKDGTGELPNLQSVENKNSAPSLSKNYTKSHIGFLTGG